MGAQYCVAWAYTKGDGVVADLAAATMWFEKAAKGGHVEAQAYTAQAYNTGEGVAVDHAAATAWFEKAAEQGHLASQYNLGCSYSQAIGVEQNHVVAAKWFKRAADRGHTGAMVNLGKACHNGHGVAQDHARAMTLSHAVVAVDGNDKTALFNLGQYHFEGNGAEDNYATALSFWQRAADLGHVESQRIIGCAHKNGRGDFEVNLELARKYLKASAAQGNAASIEILKEMNACEECGAADATRVCSGCRKVHYCDARCQQLHWTDPLHPHKAHCIGRRR